MIRYDISTGVTKIRRPWVFDLNSKWESSMYSNLKGIFSPLHNTVWHKQFTEKYQINILNEEKKFHRW